MEVYSIMKFEKWHGIGNDFIIFDCSLENITCDSHLARKLCSRNIGIGADGVVILNSATGCADLEMKIFNADGSIAEMCGNAIRCVAAYWMNKHQVQHKLSISTLAGIKEATVIDYHEHHAIVKVNMGTPLLNREAIGIKKHPDRIAQNLILSYKNQQYIFTGVSMGNPHIVTFVNDINEVDIAKIGAHFERSPLFSQKTNVEFAQICSPNQIRMRVWERGVGITKACGTGACATLVAAVLNEFVQSESHIRLDGGDLYISWDGVESPVYMTGAAEYIFSGEVKLD